MKRISVQYGGQAFSIGNRDIDDVQDEITTAAAAGLVYWLSVNEGSGAPQEARLMITASTPIALMPIASEQGDPAEPQTSDLDEFGTAIADLRGRFQAH